MAKCSTEPFFRFRQADLCSNKEVYPLEYCIFLQIGHLGDECVDIICYSHAYYSKGQWLNVGWFKASVYVAHPGKVYQ